MNLNSLFGNDTLAPAETLEEYVARLFPEAKHLVVGPLPEGKLGELLGALREAAATAFDLRDAGAEVYQVGPLARVVELLVSGGR